MKKLFTKPTWLYLAAILSGFYLLSPLYTTSYISDDSYNSLVRGQLLHNGMTVWEFTLQSIEYWIFQAARVFPLPNYHVPLHYFVQSLLLYKVLVVLVTLASVWAFAWFLSLLTGSAKFGWMAVLSVPALFQLRAWHDPLLAFHFFVPCLALFLMLAFGFFQRHLNSMRPSSLDRAWSVGFFFLALMTYEVAFTCFIFFPLLAWRQTRSLKASCRQAWPHLALFSLVVGVTFLLRSPLNPRFTRAYEVIATFRLKEALQATAMQISASLPLSYYLKIHAPLKKWIVPTDYLFFPLFLFCAYGIARDLAPSKGVRTLFWIGLPLVIGMGMIGGFSSHQTEILGVGWGMGYLPVFIGYLGVALVGTGIFAWALSRWEGRKAQTILAGLVSVGVGAIAFMTLLQNRAVAHEANTFYKFPRDVLVASLRAGVLRDVPEDATIVINGRFPIDHMWGFSNYLGKRVWVMSPAKLVETRRARFRGATNPPDSRTEDLSRQNFYVLTYQYDRFNGQTGTIYAGKLVQIRWNEKSPEPTALNSPELNLYSFGSGEIRRVPLDKAFINFVPLMRKSEEPPASVSDFDVSAFSSPLN